MTWSSPISRLGASGAGAPSEPPPWHYRRRRFKESRWFWVEEYFLQTCRACNSSYATVLATDALASVRPEYLRGIVPMLGPWIWAASYRPS